MTHASSRGRKILVSVRRDTRGKRRLRAIFFPITITNRDQNFPIRVLRANRQRRRPPYTASWGRLDEQICGARMRGGYRHRRVGMKKKERERNRANTRGAHGRSREFYGTPSKRTRRNFLLILWITHCKTRKKNCNRAKLTIFLFK